MYVQVTDEKNSSQIRKKYDMTVIATFTDVKKIHDLNKCHCILA